MTGLSGSHVPHYRASPTLPSCDGCVSGQCKAHLPLLEAMLSSPSERLGTTIPVVCLSNSDSVSAVSLPGKFAALVGRTGKGPLLGKLREHHTFCSLAFTSEWVPIS